MLYHAIDANVAPQQGNATVMVASPTRGKAKSIYLRPPEVWPEE